MTIFFWKISAKLNILLYPKFVEKQANEGGNRTTYPFPKPTLTRGSHLGQNIGLGEGYVGRFPETYNDASMY